jgi:hypothetical protein
MHFHPFDRGLIWVPIHSQDLTDRRAQLERAGMFLQVGPVPPHPSFRENELSNRGENAVGVIGNDGVAAVFQTLKAHQVRRQTLAVISLRAIGVMGSSVPAIISAGHIILARSRRKSMRPCSLRGH